MLLEWWVRAEKSLDQHLSHQCHPAKRDLHVHPMYPFCDNTPASVGEGPCRVSRGQWGSV